MELKVGGAQKSSQLSSGKQSKNVFVEDENSQKKPDFDENGETVLHSGNHENEGGKLVEMAQNEKSQDGYEVKQKRIYIIDKSLYAGPNSLISFEFNRQNNDGEKFKIFYSNLNDKFYQLQESQNSSAQSFNKGSKQDKCCSMFVGKSVFKSTFIYLLTEYDPIFFLVPILQGQAQKPKTFQTLSQILEQGLDNYQGQAMSNSQVSDDLEIIDPENNDLSLLQPFGAVSKAALFKFLNESNRLQRSLNQICDVQNLGGNSVDTQKYFAFNIEKYMSFLCNKFFLIYIALSKRYESMCNYPQKQQRKILQMQNSEKSKIPDVQQPKNFDELKVFENIDENIATMAAGYVVDEIPQSLVGEFLNEVSGTEKAEILSQNKYLLTGDEEAPKRKQSTLGFLSQKRTLGEVTNENVNQMNSGFGQNKSSQGVINNNKKKKTATTTQQPKGATVKAMNSLFKAASQGSIKK